MNMHVRSADENTTNEHELNGEHAGEPWEAVPSYPIIGMYHAS